MIDRKKLKERIFCLGITFLFCLPAFAQPQKERQRERREQARNDHGVERPPDLSQENLGRVAASASQIRGVLVKDEGLMVELKRWVAKEATDNGQVVEDSKLTDQAIFERLEQDVEFRSVATRLLQRYGYLMPTPNPDSDIAKEKDLVLKERARRLVQIESQEDSEALRPQRNDRDLERTATCDPRRDQDCPQQSRAERLQKTRSPGAIPSRETNPQAMPEQVPSQSPSPILRAYGLPQATDPLDGASLPPSREWPSRSINPDPNPSIAPQSLGQGPLDGLQPGRDFLPSMPLERSGTNEVFTGRNGMEQPSRARSAHGTTNEEDLTPVRMVH